MLRMTFDFQVLYSRFGYSILYFRSRAFHALSLLTDKTVTTKSIVNNVHCINPRGKYDRKIGTCGQAHKFAVVQMTRHLFNKMSTVSHEMCNFLKPRNNKIYRIQSIYYCRIMRERVLRKESSIRRFIPTKGQYIPIGVAVRSKT
jgi:hypothetical protein